MFTWVRYTSNRRQLIYWLLLAALLLTACGTPISASDPDGAALPAATGQCPITQPQVPLFVPPAPYSPEAPYGNFWYGSDGLWTALSPDGVWRGLPQGDEGYGQKVFFWREGYSMMQEPQPQITIIGRPLDGDAPTFEHTGGTNGYHGDMGEFMLTGVQIPIAGCWEITGRYSDQSLSFFVWVAP